MVVQRIHQKENVAKSSGFCEKLLNENGSEAVLATFSYYNYGANVSEEVHNIATNQKDYSLLNSQNISINNSEKGLATRTPPT